MTGIVIHYATNFIPARLRFGPRAGFRDRRAVVVDAGKDNETDRQQHRAEHEHRNQDRVAGETDAAGGERWGQGENL